MLTPLKTDGFNPLYASPLLPLSQCVEQEEARRQIEEHISDLQVEIDRPKTEQQDKRQELQRKVSGLPFTEVPHTYTHTHKLIWIHIQFTWLFSLERWGFSTTYKWSFAPLASLQLFFRLCTKNGVRQDWKCSEPSCLDLLTSSSWEKKTLPYLRRTAAMPRMLPLRHASGALFIDGAERSTFSLCALEGLNAKLYLS